MSDSDSNRENSVSDSSSEEIDLNQEDRNLLSDTVVENVRDRLSLLQVSAFNNTEMEEQMEKLTAAMAMMAASLTQLTDRSAVEVLNRQAEVERRQEREEAQNDQRRIQMISAVSTHCSKIEKFEAGKVMKFLKSVQHAYDLFDGIEPRTQILNYAKLLLPSSASITERDFVDFNQFAAAVRRHHRPAETFATMLQAIAMLRQKEGETIEAYVNRVQILQEKYREVKMIDVAERDYVWNEEKQSEVDRTVKDQFVLGVKSALRPFVSAHYETLDEALAAAIKAERTKHYRKCSLVKKGKNHLNRHPSKTRRN